MFCQKIGFTIAILLLITIVRAKDFLLGQEAVFTCQVNVFPILNTQDLSKLARERAKELKTARDS